MKDKTLKTLGFLATVVGVGVSLASSIIGEKQQDAKIEQKIAKALTEREE